MASIQRRRAVQKRSRRHLHVLSFCVISKLFESTYKYMQSSHQLNCLMKSQCVYQDYFLYTMEHINFVFTENIFLIFLYKTGKVGTNFTYVNNSNSTNICDVSSKVCNINDHCMKLFFSSVSLSCSPDTVN